MRLISLNIWGGKVFERLMDFLATASGETDVFCFQEILDTPSEVKLSHGFRTNVYFEIKERLKGFDGYFAPVQKGFDVKEEVDFPLNFGLATFIRQSIKVEKCEDFLVYREKNSRVLTNDTIPRNLQYVNFWAGDRKFTIGNLHGLWQPGEKIDSPERLEQSRRIREFLDNLKNPKILCGDFNLLPDTESLRIIEEGMVDLIKEWNIPTTRSELYDWPDKFADYVLVSKDVKVQSFEVLNIAVSDHLPMILEFS